MTSQPLAAPPDTPPGGEAVLGALGAAFPVEVHETLISWVFLAGGSAYKLKKPLVLPFVDYGTRERRRQMCHEEVRLNRRLAPSIYRGVVAVVPSEKGFRFEHADHAEAVEHVVWMRRFREELTLSVRVAAGSIDHGDVEAVGARLAEFHATVPVIGGVDPCESASVAADETFAELSELCPRPLLPLVDQGRRFTNAFLRTHGAQMRARPVVDGHGDLRAEHVLIDRGAVEVVDCVEFNPALRGVDPGADLSFLLMDLERLGAADIARELLSAYVAHGGDPGDAALVAFHAAQRAWVRAKVALVRARQLGEFSSAEAQDLLELARRLSWRARQPLLLVVCGLSASGKSTLAREIARVSGAQMLPADVVRKRLAGVAPTDHARSEYYTAAFNRRTYAELGRLADRELRGDAGIAIVDATFRDATDRAAFAAALGGSLGDETRIVECVAPPEVRAERAAAREREHADASDATLAIAAAQHFDPLTGVDPARHLVARMDRAVAEVATDVERWLDSP